MCNHLVLSNQFKIILEDPVGFEPTIRELQSLALPLGYGSKNCKNKMVGMTGFEPATSWSQTRRSTKLSYIPTIIRMARPPGVEPGTF